MVTQRIALLKDVAGFKAGQVINASAAAIKAHKLTLADYSPQGSHMTPTPSDLPETVAAAEPATKPE